MKLKVGDKVKLNENVKMFRYGKGMEEYEEYTLEELGL